MVGYIRFAMPCNQHGIGVYSLPRRAAPADYALGEMPAA